MNKYKTPSSVGYFPSSVLVKWFSLSALVVKEYQIYERGLDNLFIMNSKGVELEGSVLYEI